MSSPRHTIRRPPAGHTLMEMMAAMVAASVLMAGLASVMLIGRQIAFTPSAPAHRLDAARLVNEIAGDLRFATHIIEQSPYVLDFVVPDRDSDGAAERFRYQWSGTPGDPLTRSRNGGAATTVLDLVQEFQVTPTLRSTTSTFATTVTSAETLLASNTTIQGAMVREISAETHTAQQINPLTFPSVPVNATSWSATRIDLYSQSSGTTTGTCFVQLRPAGDPNQGPTSIALGSVTIAESGLTSTMDWNVVNFATPVRGLLLHRNYTIAIFGSSVSGQDEALHWFSGPSLGLLESSDSGATWIKPSRQIFYRLYGTYSTPGTNHTITMRFVQHARIMLRSGEQNHARIDTRIPLINEPELLSKYWRTDFDDDPTAVDANGDGTLDWTLAGGATLNGATLVDGIWQASGSLETLPLDDFTQNTTVEVRCKNVTQGGDGAVVRINADRQGGTHAPIFATLRLQSDNTQTLTLYGKSADAVNVPLFTRQKLPNDFIRFRLTILPAGNVVNLQVEDEDQGTFTYPTYAPSSNNRFATIFADTSTARFDYVEVRVAAP